MGKWVHVRMENEKFTTSTLNATHLARGTSAEE